VETDQCARAKPVREKGGAASRSGAEAWSVVPNETSAGDPERVRFVHGGGCRSEWSEEAEPRGPAAEQAELTERGELFSYSKPSHSSNASSDGRTSTLESNGARNSDGGSADKIAVVSTCWDTRSTRATCQSMCTYLTGAGLLTSQPLW